MEVRKATASDLDDLAQMSLDVHQIHVQEHPDEFKTLSFDDVRTSMSRELSQANTEIFVCLDQGRAVGFILVRIEARPENPVQKPQRFLYIDQIEVKSAHRRLGIGRSLIEAAGNYANQMGIKRIILDVWNFNTGAVSFFRAQGFHPRIERWVMPVEQGNIRGRGSAQDRS